MHGEPREFFDQKVHYHGVGGISICLENELVLVDPYFEPRDHYLERIVKQSGVPTLKDIHIYISHGHFDHYSFVPEIVKRYHADHRMQIMLPLDVYHRWASRLKAENVSVCPAYQYDSFDTAGYSVKAVPGEHVRIPLRKQLRLVADPRNWDEIRQHMAHPARGVVNYVFTIADLPLTIGHIGSAAIGRGVPGHMYGLDVLFLAKSDYDGIDRKHIRQLNPGLCVPIHHMNNGLRVVPDIDIQGLLDNPSLKGRVQKKDVFWPD